ncbi:hypothetical protein TWF718_002817 [Orbilia javanica]|uniref:Uncharacterized protein n=1 Tax=Orbilia javanica TaxID=47235 RepID=A0AAN8RJ54_9PEZI
MSRKNLDQAGSGGKEERKTENKTNNSCGSGGGKQMGLIDPKSGHWASVWWKPRVGIAAASSPLITAPKIPLNKGTIRDINGRLCGADLHKGIDVPPLNHSGSRIRKMCQPPLGVSPTRPQIYPRSFQQPPPANSTKPVEKLCTPCSLDSPRIFSPLPVGLHQNSSAISDKSSIYSVSTTHEAKVPIIDSQNPTVLDFKMGTSIYDLYRSKARSPRSIGGCSKTPTEEQNFAWDKETTSQWGIITGIDGDENSIYGDAPLGEFEDGSCDSATTTTQAYSTSPKETFKTSISTDSSTPDSSPEKTQVRPQQLSPKLGLAPTMLEIRNDFVRSLSSDDTLSTKTSFTNRQLEEDIMFHLEGDSKQPYSLDVKLTCQTIYDGESGDGTNPSGESSNNRQEPSNNGIIETWRSGVHLSDSQSQFLTTKLHHSPSSQDAGISHRRSFDDSASNFGATSLIGGLEPQHPGLKRLGNSRRRYERRSGGEANEPGAWPVKNERDEQEVQNLRAEIEAARSKTLSFQAILQRTSQRFVDAQNENEELQRQISDLRDHQRLLYEALTASNVHEVSSTHLPKDLEGNQNFGASEGVAEATHKDDPSDIIEENNRLKTQVKSLARELAGREEEVRILIEEMGRKGDIYKAAYKMSRENREAEMTGQEVLTGKSASRMAGKLKWWRRFPLG